MAKVSDVKKAVTTGQELRPAQNTLKTLLERTDVKHRFEEMLGKKSAGFISSILSAVNLNKDLKLADPASIIASAAIAASLDLPVNQNLGMAHLVPYSGKCQFQMGWKGFVQLAMRSGQYRTMNVAVVFDGEITKHNRITGEMEFGDRKSNKKIGYIAYFKLLNGFEKYYYMTIEEAEAHGRRYSKSFDTGQWKKDFDAMAMKTVIKMLLSKYGILSIEMQKAIETDQAVIKEDGTPEYVDNVIDVEKEEKIQESGTSDFTIALNNASTIEELNDLIGQIIEAGIKGEAYTNFIKIRDARATKIRDNV